MDRTSFTTSAIAYDHQRKALKVIFFGDGLRIPSLIGAITLTEDDTRGHQRSAYAILDVDEPKVLTEILRSGSALIIFDVDDSSLMEVATGVTARWLREAGT